MPLSTSRLTLVGAALVTLAACSSEAPTAPEATLTPSERREVLATLVSAIGELPSDVVPDSGIPLAASATTRPTFTYSCARDGSLRMRATVRSDAAAQRRDADLRIDFDQCRADAPSGRILTFGGRPEVRLQLSWTYDAALGDFRLSGRYDGALQFELEELSGRCSLSAEFSFTEASPIASLSGLLCGEPVAVDIR